MKACADLFVECYYVVSIGVIKNELNSVQTGQSSFVKFILCVLGSRQIFHVLQSHSEGKDGSARPANLALSAQVALCAKLAFLLVTK
jgi:hypothetical protein